MIIKAQVLNREAITKRFEKIATTVPLEVGRAVATGTLLIHSTAIKSIQAQGSSSGVQVRYGPRREVKVSKPGSPPNSDTGRLVNSIEFTVDVEKGVGAVGTNLLYGAALEFGTSTVEARPWLAPAFRKNAEKIMELIRKAIRIP